MQIRRAGLRLGGLYTSASSGRKREVVMSTTAQQKPEALAFWRKHGLDATRDAFSVSRSALRAWRAKHRAGGPPGCRTAAGRAGGLNHAHRPPLPAPDVPPGRPRAAGGGDAAARRLRRRAAAGGRGRAGAGAPALDFAAPALTAVSAQTWYTCRRGLQRTQNEPIMSPDTVALMAMGLGMAALALLWNLHRDMGALRRDLSRDMGDLRVRAARIEGMLAGAGLKAGSDSASDVT